MYKLNFSQFFSLVLMLVTSSAWADNPIKIEATPSLSGPGILGCHSKTPSTRNVRFQSLNTSSGLVFQRRTLSESLFYSCFEPAGKKILAVTNIKECAEATKAAGLQMFLWADNATCTGYVQGIPKNMTCKTKEAVVVYSLDDELAAQSYTLTLMHSVSSIWATWSGCHPDYPKMASKFELTWNGTTIAVNGSTSGYRLHQSLDLCNNKLDGVNSSLLKVSLVALDDTGKPATSPDTKVLVPFTGPGIRIVLTSGNCMYYDRNGPAAGGTFDSVVSFCDLSLHGTMFIEFMDGDFVDYMSDLAALKTLTLTTPISVNDHFVGLRYADGQWRWLSNRPQDNATSVWTLYGVSRKCAQTSSMKGYKLMSSVCQTDVTPIVCHEFIP